MGCAKNTICYSDNGAGLSDRIAVFNAMLRWSIALGAAFQPDIPCRLLAPSHNNNVSVPCTLPWSHYLLFPAGHTTQFCPCSLNVTSFYKVQRYISVPSEGQLITLSPTVDKAANMLLKEIQSPSEFDLLHIRRSDAIDACNTSLPRMLASLKTRKFQTSFVIFSTDEKSADYTLAIVEALRARNLNVVFIEPLLSQLYPFDNYFSYAILIKLGRLASHVHEWRRHFSCP